MLATFDNAWTTTTKNTTTTMNLNDTTNFGISATCQENCSACVRILPQMQNPYFPNNAKTTATVEDRISPIDMKLIADFHFGVLPQPPEYRSQLRNLSNINLPCLLNGTVIFVDTVNVDEFLSTIVPHLTVQFVLVTGDSDASMPQHVMQHKELEAFLSNNNNDTKILHWYAMNCDGNPNPRHFTCLPNGINQFMDQRSRIQSFYERGVGLQGLNASNILSNSDRKNITLFASFRISNNFFQRQPVWDMACNPDGLLFNMTLCAWGVSNHTHYELIRVSKFVLSPHGLGLDCYRTYETLYLGSFPIVRRSSLDELYEGLPVLIVRNWNELAQEGFLERVYADFMSRLDTFQWEKLYKGYWYAKFRSHYPTFLQYETISGAT
jgi:hypothetical protein